MKTQRKVLVVDDDPVIARSFDRVLSGKGYAVISARDGDEALRKLHDEDYDVVFTDIKMPGMSGIEVAERIRATQPWLPVVIVTGYGTDENEARAEAAGVSGFLRKPLSPEMIEGSAQKALLERDAPAAPAPSVEAAAMPQPAAEETANALKGIALFIAAPFIGLLYILAGPFIGLGMLAWMGTRELAKHRATRRFAIFVKNIALFLAAPFVGLVYAVLFPFIGLGMLAWMGVKALVKRPAAN
ncbi:MAG: response regulator [Gammaproteobacteria bacterium]|nr:response regulator [Gammaproteobacteria bacterium]